jgi:hypothetical protein
MVKFVKNQRMKAQRVEQQQGRNELKLLIIIMCDFKVYYLDQDQ